MNSLTVNNSVSQEQAPAACERQSDGAVYMENYAALPSVKSKWISSYGNDVPRSLFTSKPLPISVVTSVCTPLTSRSTNAAISRMVISPAPVMAIRMSMRFGVSTLCIICQLGKETTLSFLDFFPSAASLNADSTSAVKFSIDSIRIVTVLMLDTSADGFNVSQKLGNQLFNGDKADADFLVTNVFVIAYTTFVVVTHHTHAINDISHAVFVVVLTTQYGGVYFPYTNSYVLRLTKMTNEFFIQSGWHSKLPLVLVVKDNNKKTCCPQLQHVGIDSSISGRYTVHAPYKAGAGICTPEMLSAIYDAPASFLSSALTHAKIMVGWAGEPKGSPVSDNAGSANPVQFTTSEICTSGGEGNSLLSEAAIMATIPALTQPEIAIINGQVVTSSLAVASYFFKRHDDVLKKIRTLDCSPEFCARNFAETSISVNQPNGGTRKLPCYQITRDGFAFLAMGFTGKRAARFKEVYINAFNQIEKQLSKPSSLNDVAHNARVLYSHLSVIHKIWLQQLYPMLVKAESPLAISLYDRINDAAALASLINQSLNPSEVRGHK